MSVVFPLSGTNTALFVPECCDKKETGTKYPLFVPVLKSGSGDPISPAVIPARVNARRLCFLYAPLLAVFSRERITLSKGILLKNSVLWPAAGRSHAQPARSALHGAPRSWLEVEPRLPAFEPRRCRHYANSVICMEIDSQESVNLFEVA